MTDSLYNETVGRRYRTVVSAIGWTLVIMTGLFMFNPLSLIQTIVGEIPSKHKVLMTVVNGILETVSYMVMFIVPAICFYAMMKSKKPERIRFEVRMPAYAPLLILAGLAVLIGAAYINAFFCQLIGYEIPPDMMPPELDYSNSAAVVMYMTTAIAPAVAEEILFRGVIYGNLRPFGRPQAILLSALLFGIMHQNVQQTFYTFMGGIAMALMYEITGSIWCSTLFHLINNELSVIQTVISGRYGYSGDMTLMIMDFVVFLLGILSILYLLMRWHRLRKAENAQERRGIFGVDLHERPRNLVSLSMAARKIWVPGMIVFLAVAISQTAFLWLMVRIAVLAA